MTAKRRKKETQKKRVAKDVGLRGGPIADAQWNLRACAH
jgi:hypothetical protein